MGIFDFFKPKVFQFESDLITNPKKYFTGTNLIGKINDLDFIQVKNYENLIHQINEYIIHHYGFVKSCEFKSFSKINEKYYMSSCLEFLSLIDYQLYKCNSNNYDHSIFQGILIHRIYNNHKKILPLFNQFYPTRNEFYLELTNGKELITSFTNKYTYEDFFGFMIENPFNIPNNKINHYYKMNPPNDIISHNSKTPVFNDYLKDFFISFHQKVKNLHFDLISHLDYSLELMVIIKNLNDKLKSQYKSELSINITKDLESRLTSFLVKSNNTLVYQDVKKYITHKRDTIIKFKILNFFNNTELEEKYEKEIHEEIINLRTDIKTYNSNPKESYYCKRNKRVFLPSNEKSQIYIPGIYRERYLNNNISKFYGIKEVNYTKIRDILYEVFHNDCSYIYEDLEKLMNEKIIGLTQIDTIKIWELYKQYPN